MARPGLTKHPKFLRLMHILGVPAPHARGYLELLWETAYENGEPRIGDSVDVELVAGWPGESGKLCDALLTCGGSGRAGFIEDEPGEPGRYRVHDLFDHAPDYVQRRMKRELARQSDGKTISRIRSEAAKQRWANASDCKRQTLASSQDASGATPAPARARAPAPAPAPALEDKCRERPVFVPPAIAEVADYCKQRGNQVDAEQFVAYYAARDWIPGNGRKRMRDWKAAVVTWEKNHKRFEGKGNASQRTLPVGPGQCFDPNAGIGDPTFGVL